MSNIGTRARRCSWCANTESSIGTRRSHPSTNRQSRFFGLRRGPQLEHRLANGDGNIARYVHADTLRRRGRRIRLDGLLSWRRWLQLRPSVLLEWWNFSPRNRAISFPVIWRTEHHRSMDMDPWFLVRSRAIQTSSPTGWSRLVGVARRRDVTPSFP